MRRRFLLQIGLHLLAGGAFAGCATSSPAPPPPPGVEVSSILVLPSARQAALGLETGVVAGDAIRTRNQSRLGGAPVPGAGPMFVARGVRDDQRIINGRNQSNLSIRVRSGSQRGR